MKVPLLSLVYAPWLYASLKEILGTGIVTPFSKSIHTIFWKKMILSQILLSPSFQNIFITLCS